MTVFLLIVVFTMLAFLLLSLPNKRSGPGDPGETDNVTTVASGSLHSGESAQSKPASVLVASTTKVTAD